MIQQTDMASNEDSNPMNSLLSELMELGESMKEKYDIITTTIQAFDAITDTTPGIKKLIAFEGNDESDKAQLRALALTGLYESIQKDSSMITFQRGLLTLTYLKLMYMDFFEKTDRN